MSGRIFNFPFVSKNLEKIASKQLCSDLHYKSIQVVMSQIKPQY